MLRLEKWTLTFFVVAACAPSAWCQQWTESFENGQGGAKSYHNEPGADLEIAADSPAEGKQYLRAALPGKRKLEGVNVTATALDGGRVATVTARVRGSGQIWLCLISANGWLYSPRTVPLTDQWQTVSLSKSLMARDKTLGIHFLSKDIQQGAVFEVDDIQVTLADPPKVYDAQVGPWRIEAEEFTLRRGDVALDESASGGRSVGSQQYYRLVQMPFPRTSRPVTVYLRVKAGSGDEEYRLITTLGGNTQFLANAQPKSAKHWQWVRFRAVRAGEVGNQFDIDFRQSPGTVETVSIDAVVIATRDDLDDIALDGAPALFSRRPLTVVSRAKNPPELDGIPNDACWENTAACTGFVGVRSLTPAQSDTTVRLCYDDDNLYALFVCEEPILSVAQQRRHEFAAKVDERDGDVYRDDSVIMLLDPANAGKQAFEFTINSLGVIADARCPGPDLWESRDVGWNSSAHASGTIGDGVWSVEVAVPFASLVSQPPAVGDVWQACLGRIARARDENTTWNTSNRGFHDPRSPGALVFAGPVPGVVLDAPTSLRLGKNPFVATIAPCKRQPAHVYVLSSVSTPNGTAHSYQFTEAQDAPTEAVASLEVNEEAELQVAHGILDASTLQPLCLTPVLSRTVKSTLATVTLACDGPYELLLNDELLGHGQQADEVEIKAPLQKGANVFAVRLRNGTAAVNIRTPGLDPRSVNWKMSFGETADAASPTTDDSDWETATKVSEHPKLGDVIGHAGKPVLLRHTLLWERTRIWPTPEPALCIARNSNQHLTVIADGLPKRKLIDWTIYLAVPPDFEILGSTGYYGNVEYQPRFLCTQLGVQTVEGRKMQVARIVANKPVLTGRHYIFSLFNVFVRRRDGLGEAEGDETTFVYWSEANDGTVVEPPQTIPVRVLPPLNGKQPQELVWQLWGSFFGNMNNHAMRKATLETARLAGLNDLVAGDLWTSENAPKYGIQHTMGFNFQAWSLNMKPYLTDHRDERLIGQDGQPNDGYLCTTLLLGGSWPAVEAKLQEKIETTRAHTMDYDYEYSPLTGPHSCYCPRCLEEFRDYTKLESDAKLDPVLVQDQYEQQWVDFMAYRVARIFRKFRETIHRLAPGTKFSVYSGYQTPENPKRYGVNWDYIGKFQACDRAGCGYGRPADAIPATVDGLKGIPVLFGELVQPYATKETIPPVPMTKARLLRRALDSTGGVLIYNRLPLDGRSWYAIAETTRLVATHEDLFVAGEHGALPGSSEARVQTLSNGKTTLVCTMNGGSSTLDLRIPLPPDAGNGHEFYSGRSVAAGQTVSYTLAAGETAVFVLGE